MDEIENNLRYLDLTIDHLINDKIIKVGGIMTIVFDPEVMEQNEAGEKILLDPDGNDIGVVDSKFIHEVFMILDTFKYEWFNTETIDLIVCKLKQTRESYIYCNGYIGLYDKYPWCKMDWMK